MKIQALLYGVAVLTGVQADCLIRIQEVTWKFVPGRDSSHFGIPTVESCQELCSSHPECQGYTWRFDVILGYTCEEYQQLEDLHACPGCYSGTVPFAYDGACTLNNDNLVGLVFSESMEDCIQACSEADGCESFTWYDQSTSLPNFCFQFSDCSSVTPCQGCSSGELNCIAIPTHCSNYLVMDDSTRNEYSEGEAYYCDATIYHTSPDWKGPGHYRLQAPAGIRIPTSSPNTGYCGTVATGWIKDEEGAIEQMEVGKEITVTACFHSTDGDSCSYHNEITVTLCPGEYYVYYLPNAPSCDLRYCASNNK